MSIILDSSRLDTLIGIPLGVLSLPSEHIATTTTRVLRRQGENNKMQYEAASTTCIYVEITNDNWRGDT